MVGLPVRMLEPFHREFQLLLDIAFVLQALAVTGPGGGAGTDPDPGGDVARLVRHVPGFAQTPVPQSCDQVQRHQAARNFHEGQQDRHIGVESDVHTGQECHAGGVGSRRVGAVITRDRRSVDLPHLGGVLQQEVGGDADHEVQGEAQEREAGDVVDVFRLDLGELLAALPADGDQQVHGQALVDHIRELKPDLQERDEEPEVEEQQQWLKEVGGEVVPELMKHWCLPVTQHRNAGGGHRRGGERTSMRPRETDCVVAQRCLPFPWTARKCAVAVGLKAVIRNSVVSQSYPPSHSELWRHTAHREPQRKLLGPNP